MIDYKYKGVGGWLLLFCVGLTVLGPLLTLANISNGITEASKYSDRFPSLMTVTFIDSILSVSLMAFSVYAGVALWGVKPNAIKTAKTYLLVLLGYSIVEIPLLVAAGLPSQANDAVVGQGITGAARTLVYVLVWTAYLNRSKRVQATYGEPTATQYIGLGLSTRGQGEAASPSIDSMKSVSGLYIYQGDESERIELNLDGTFRLQKRHVDLEGQFEAYDDSLIFRLGSGQVTRAKLGRETFTDEDGKTWMRIRPEREVGIWLGDIGAQSGESEQPASDISVGDEAILTSTIYRVIAIDGIEYESVGIDILRQLFLDGQINKDSLFNEASGSHWRCVGDVFNLGKWENERNSEKFQSGAETTQSRSPSGAFLKPTILAEQTNDSHAPPQPGRSSGMVAAAILLLVNDALALLAIAIVGAQDVRQLGGKALTTAIIIDVVVAIGLFRGKTKWKRWAIGRAVLGAIAYGVVFPATGMTTDGWIEGGFQIIFAAGIVTLLYAGPPSRRRLIIGAGAVLLAWLGAFGTGFISAQNPGLSAGEFQQWALRDHSFVDDKVGVRLDLPEGWSLLSAANPILVSVPNAKAVAVHLKSGCFAVLIVEPTSASISSLDNYLDLVLKNRVASLTSQVALGRDFVQFGEKPGRRMNTRWEEEGRKEKGFSTACNDEFNYYLLSGWCAESAFAGAFRSFQELENGFHITKSFDARIEEMARPMLDEMPYMSMVGAKRLVSELFRKQMTAPDQAQRFGFETFQRGRGLLHPAERAESDRIFSIAFSSLLPGDYARLLTYQRRASRGQTVSAEEGKDGEQILKAALATLSPNLKARLQAISDRAIELAFKK